MMLTNSKEHQNEVEFLCLEDLVTEDHLLRRLDKYIDFSYILDKVIPYRKKNGALARTV